METLAKVLISIYRQSPHHDRWVVACLEGMWRGLMGERIARICRPVDMRSGQLVVSVLSPSWHPVLSRMAPELLERIRSVTGNEVRRLVLRLERESAGESPPQPG